MTFRLRHLLAALVLHALLFAVLLGGLQCTRKVQRPPVIRAVLLDPDRKETAQQRADEKRRQDERRRAEEQRRKLEAEQKRKADAEQKRKEEEARRKLEAEAERKKQQDEEARKQRELAEKKKAEDEARRRQEEQERRERDEQAQREIQERARMEENMRQEAMRRELERESQARAASQREVQLSEWVDALTRHIARNWVRPPSIATQFECLLRVQQLPDGTVTSAKIVKTCGSAALDKSIEDAVYRASPLPKPRDPSVFDRDLDIIFTPGP